MGQKRWELTAILRERQLLQATATISLLRFEGGRGSLSSRGGDGTLIAGRSGRYDGVGCMSVKGRAKAKFRPS